MRSDREPIGYVAAIDADMTNLFANVSVIMRPDLWSTGVGMKAVGLLIDYLFSIAPFRKLYADSVEYSYIRFSRGASKFFHVEGVLRAHHYFDGVWWDKYLLAIYRDDWLEHGRPLIDRICGRNGSEYGV